MVTSSTSNERFEREMLPHLDAAFNLARWLAGNEADARDVVQESFMRALGAFQTLRGTDARAWLLAIVRNTAYSFLSKRSKHSHVSEEALMDQETPDPGPPAHVGAGERADMVRHHLEMLPAPFREVIVLREMEGMSYKEIADVAGISIGTVMSRLARARKRLADALAPSGQEAADGL
jgi:RNA polymerase sigma-70 factor (ECF subfamily)